MNAAINNSIKPSALIKTTFPIILKTITIYKDPFSPKSATKFLIKKLAICPS